VSTSENSILKQPAHRIPLWLKVSYTAFMTVLIPIYAVNYGMTNFLWFCDVALLVTLVGLWREDRLLISIAAVAIVLPQILWVIDFSYGLATGGGTLISLAAYMFEPDRSLFLRGLSLFHGWLPFVLVFAVWKLGYDKRAFKIQSGLSWVVLVGAFLALPVPAGEPGPLDAEVYPAGNVNKVLGWDDGALPQKSMPRLAWLGVLMAACPLCIYVPSHLVFSRIVPRPHEEIAVAVAPECCPILVS
jgi:hypothetical protein